MLADMNAETGNRLHWAWVVAWCAVVLLWRAGAYRWPSALITVPDGLRLPMLLMGLVFLASGLWAWWARPGRWTTLFLVYGLCGGIHWGGAIGASDTVLATALFLVYLAITALGDGVLLHLALVYPQDRVLAMGWRVAIYAPAGLGVVLALGAGVIPRAVLEAAVGIVLLVANLFSMAAGILFIVRLFTAGSALSRAARLPLIAAGMVVGSVVALLGAGGVLPGEPEAWNLALMVIPVTLAIGLVTQSVGSSGEPA